MTRLLSTIEQAFQSPRIGSITLCLMQLILHTGARKEELQSLRREHIKGNVISRDDHKTFKQTQKPRIIHLSEVALRILDRVHSYCVELGADDSEWVFPSVDTKRHRKAYVSELNYPVGLIGEKAGLGKLKPHNFRSLYINFSIDSGVPIEIVSENVGHANIATTRAHYLKNKKSLVKQSIETVGNRLAELQNA
jgi:integrase